MEKIWNDDISNFFYSEQTILTEIANEGFEINTTENPFTKKIASLQQF